VIIDKNNYSIDCFHATPLTTDLFKNKNIERKQHLLQAMPYAKMPGHVMEFGVYSGKTMQHISKHFANQTCWGFDSFVGLPEPWHITSGANGKTHPAGKFDMRVEPVQPVFERNVKLVSGWFNESIPPWMLENPGAIKFLHVDCDLYSSTLTILTLLNDRIIPGTVIAFDEMYPWVNVNKYNLWAEGEFKALGEWLNLHNRSFSPLLHSNHQQCSIIIER
jgi:hypothetical protein